MESMKRFKVVHLIDILEKGGAQKIVADLAKPGERFEVEVWSFFGGVYEKEIVRKGAKVRVLGIRPEKIGFRYPLNLFRTLRWLRGNFAQVRPHIFQTHLLGADIWGRLIAPEGIKIIQTVHSAEKFRGNLFSRFGLKTFLFDRWLESKTQVIVTVSKAAKKALKKEGINPHKIQVIYPGVDLAKFAPDSRARKVWRLQWGVNSKVVIGAVGRLDKVKRFDLLLRAFKIIADKALLVLVGDGPERENLEALASQLGLKKRVLFLGYRSDVAEILNGFDVFVLPSKWEGFPLALVEAAANRKAIVAAQVGGIPEFIEDRHNGLLFEGSAARLLAQKLIYLIEHPEERARLAKNAFRRAQDFSIAAMIERYKQIYLSLV